jgi:hypothetical protein
MPRSLFESALDSPTQRMPPDHCGTRDWGVASSLRRAYPVVVNTPAARSNCVAKDRRQKCAFRPSRECTMRLRGLPQHRRNTSHPFRQRRTVAEREPFAMTQATRHSSTVRGRTRRESMIDARGGLRGAYSSPLNRPCRLSAPAHETESREADQHHRPGRGLRHRAAEDEVAPVADNGQIDIRSEA